MTPQEKANINIEIAKLATSISISQSKPFAECFSEVSKVVWG